MPRPAARAIIRRLDDKQTPSFACSTTMLDQLRLTQRSPRRAPSPVIRVALCGLLLTACATTSPESPTGAQVYTTHCAACHGETGQGNGPVAESIAVNVPNLRLLNARYGAPFPDDAVAGLIDGRNLPDAHGARQMPVWGLVFAATESIVPGAEAPATRIDALLDYLHTIQDP